MKKYNVVNELYPNGKWITKEEWEEMVMQEYEQIMEYQEMSRYGIDKDGNKYYMGIELKTAIEESE